MDNKKDIDLINIEINITRYYLINLLENIKSFKELFNGFENVTMDLGTIIIKDNANNINNTIKSIFDLCNYVKKLEQNAISNNIKLEKKNKEFIKQIENNDFIKALNDIKTNCNYIINN